MFRDPIYDYSFRAAVCRRQPVAPAFPAAPITLGTWTGTRSGRESGRGPRPRRLCDTTASSCHAPPSRWTHRPRPGGQLAALGLEWAGRLSGGGPVPPWRRHTRMVGQRRAQVGSGSREGRFAWRTRAPRPSRPSRRTGAELRAMLSFARSFSCSTIAWPTRAPSFVPWRPARPALAWLAPKGNLARAAAPAPRRPSGGRNPLENPPRHRPDCPARPPPSRRLLPQGPRARCPVGDLHAGAAHHGSGPGAHPEIRQEEPRDQGGRPGEGAQGRADPSQRAFACAMAWRAFFLGARGFPWN